MKTIDEMKQSIMTMPANQEFTVKDITGGEHNPGLWQHLCHMDDGRHTREDGCVFVGDETRTSFWWQQTVATQ